MSTRGGDFPSFYGKDGLAGLMSPSHKQQHEGDQFRLHSGSSTQPLPHQQQQPDNHQAVHEQKQLEQPIRSAQCSGSALGHGGWLTDVWCDRSRRDLIEALVREQHMQQMLHQTGEKAEEQQDDDDDEEDEEDGIGADEQEEGGEGGGADGEASVWKEQVGCVCVVWGVGVRWKRASASGRMMSVVCGRMCVSDEARVPGLAEPDQEEGQQLDRPQQLEVDHVIEEQRGREVGQGQRRQGQAVAGEGSMRAVVQYSWSV